MEKDQLEIIVKRFIAKLTNWPNKEIIQFMEQASKDHSAFLEFVSFVTSRKGLYVPDSQDEEEIITSDEDEEEIEDDIVFSPIIWKK